MNYIFKRLIPHPFLSWLSRSTFLWRIIAKYYSLFGRPVRLAETSKAKSRRIAAGFFEKYCQGVGLDIGYGGDLLAANCRGWDFEDGDAQLLTGVADNTYDFVYSSHTLEHMVNPTVALLNWWRVLKPGGYLILFLPHRDLYEKKEKLPSRWNSDHKHFFLPDQDAPPDTIGLRHLVESTLVGAEIISILECSAGHMIKDSYIHSDGEYSIEAIVRKVAISPSKP